MAHLWPRARQRADEQTEAVPSRRLDTSPEVGPPSARNSMFSFSSRIQEGQGGKFRKRGTFARSILKKGHFSAVFRGILPPAFQYDEIMVHFVLIC